MLRRIVTSEPWTDLILPQLSTIALPAAAEKIQEVAKKQLTPPKEKEPELPKKPDEAKRLAEFGV